MKLNYPLIQVIAVIKKWLYIEDEAMLTIMLAVYLVNQLPGDPLWLIFIAPPSSTKTELLRALDGYNKTVFISNLTPATLVSGIIPKKDRPDPSLIYKIDGKTMVIKDFTTILSMRSENQQEILSQLREVYDGQYTKAFGNGKIVSWSGKVGLLAACTPVYDKHYAVIGALGDRFMLYRSAIIDNRKMGARAIEMTGQEEQMRNEIKAAVHKFLDQFQDLGHISFNVSDKVKKMIVDLATFAALARCPVDRDYRTQQVTYIPTPEGPARLVKQLMLLYQGLALVHGNDAMDMEIYEVIKKVGRDLVSAQRLKVIRYLWQEIAFEGTGVTRTTRQVSEAVLLPGRTVLIIMEDLKILGLLNGQQEGKNEKDPYKWQITTRAREIINGAEVFMESKGVLMQASL